MRRLRRSSVLFTVAGLALAGCSDKPADKPAPAATTPAATSSAPEEQEQSAADPFKECVDKILAEKDSDGEAPPCEDLSPDDYFKAVQEANKRGREELQRQLDEAGQQ